MEHYWDLKYILIKINLSSNLKYKSHLSKQ